MCIYKIYDMIISHRIFHLVSICIYVSIHIYILYTYIYIYIYTGTHATAAGGGRGPQLTQDLPLLAKTYEAGERGVTCLSDSPLNGR